MGVGAFSGPVYDLNAVPTNYQEVLRRAGENGLPLIVSAKGQTAVGWFLGANGNALYLNGGCGENIVFHWIHQPSITFSTVENLFRWLNHCLEATNQPPTRI